MRDSDIAIGGLVLLGIVGAFAYFLFPNFITSILRGPSYTEIVRAQESELAAFNRETEVVFSYLADSWTMKIYRTIDSMVGGNGYEDWIQQVRAERSNLVQKAVQDVEIQRQVADSLSRSLESKKASRDRTKESIFKLSKSPLDSEIEALQNALSERKSEPYPYFSPGKRVRIDAGPLAGLEGTIVRKKGSLRMIVSVAFLQRSIAVDLEPADLRLAA